MEVLAENISLTGGYFIANASPHTGDTVKICLYLQPREELETRFTAVGTVVRVDYLPDDTCRFAVDFESIPEWQHSDTPPYLLV